MELFPAQPDLSLQISLPNSSKGTSGGGGGGWRKTRTSEEDKDGMDLGFWKRALDNSKNSSSPIFSSSVFSKPCTENNTPTTNSCFDRSGVHLEAIASMTDGYSGSDLKVTSLDYVFSQFSLFVLFVIVLIGLQYLFCLIIESISQNLCVTAAHCPIREILEKEKKVGH